ncbi:Sulfhydrogenase 1 subunit gamma [Candidatus Anstonella stagnisolia]|nr:Sulfhydrogenase 1 subunit gamma [Candidatus Anstonella stagnisolia]
MAIGFQKYKIEKIIDETADTKTFVLVPLSGSMFSFKPGQFVTVRLVDEKGMFQKDEAGKPLVRSYSISSSPFEEGYFCVTIKSVGSFTHHIFALKEGAIVEVMGPLGNFCIDEEKMKDVVMLAGGSGVTPFVSMLSYYARKKSNLNLTLLYSCKTEKDFVLYSRLKSVCGENTCVFFTLTRPESNPNWDGKVGRMDANMIKQACEGKLEGKYFFICGPKEMITSMQQILRTLEIDEAHIVVEKWS